MQKYTAEEVERTAAVLDAMDMPGTAHMLTAFAAELRAKETQAGEYAIRAVIKNSGGTAALVGMGTSAHPADDASHGCTVTVDEADDSIKIAIARSVVNDPRPGDLLIISPTNIKVFVGQAGPVFDEFAWKAQCDANPRAVALSRREERR